MKYSRLFVLLVLLVGLWNVSETPVDAAPNCPAYYSCTAEAQDDYWRCLDLCAGIIACEAVCQTQYDDALLVCADTYPC